MTDLLDDLIAFFDARNTGNATNEFLNRCKEEKNKQLNIHSVVKSLPEWQIYQKAHELDEKDFEQWMYNNQ